MKHYHKTQIGTVIIASVLVIGLIIYFLSVKPISNYTFIAYGILFFIMVLFSFLTVKVDDEYLIWFFGPWFWKKKVALSDIQSVSEMKTKWYWGYGIRLTPYGWLYTVSGQSAVRVELKSGESFLLGYKTPRSLINALQEKISETV
ncbi:hypothetical protein [Gallaecimonas sp. GXIMD1310]|uniref:hypothetical protein n=1 Tax=Gallaecimonas sp. GXIMD1310 TaxID=3131926 RepID=UPI00324D267A